MSIPGTEFKPDRFRTQPQRHIRAYLAEASEQETLGFLEVLRQRAAIKALSFVLQIALSLLFLILGMAYELPLVAILGILLIPAYKALLSLALSPGISSFRTMAGALVAIIVMAVAIFGGGFLAHELFSQKVSANGLPFAFVLNAGWIEWLVLALIAVLTAVWFTTNTTLARVGAVVLNILCFVPFALAGWQLGRVGIQPALATLALAFLRLTLTAVLMVISLWVLRIKPKGSNGWLIFAILLILLGVAVYLNLGDRILAPIEEPEVYQEIIVTPAQTTEAETPIPASPTPSPTATRQLEPSPTPRPTNTPEPSPTPFAQKARVISDTGLFCRAEAGGIKVVTVFDYRAIVELTGGETKINTRTWVEVLTDSGAACWVDSTFIERLDP